MSAPPAGSANGSPLPGYYPDPSIPGYIRYWDGTQWVPGTSRPQPGPGEPPPEPPVSRGGGPSRGGVPTQRASAPQRQASPPVPEETGPVFLDEDENQGDGGLPEVRPRGDVTAREEQEQVLGWEDPRRTHGDSPGTGGAWQADASRQSGFGGEYDQHVAWSPDAPAEGPAHQWSPPAPADPGDTVGIRLPRGGVTGQGDAGSRQPDPQHWQQHRQWDEDGAARQAQQAQAQQGQQAQAEALRQQGATAYQQGHGGPGVGAPHRTAGAQQPPVPPQHDQATPPWQGAGQQAPQTQGPARPQPRQQAERPAWAQQVHDLAQHPGGQAPGPTPGPEGVAPWRPPVDDPFLRAAQQQARPAGLGRRLGAALFDGLLLTVVMAAAAVPFVGKAVDHIQSEIDAARQAGVTRRIWLVDGTTGVYLAIVLGAFLVFGVLYEALPTAKWGRTLGKKLFGLTVLDVERQDPPRFGASLRRWLVHRLLTLLMIGPLNELWCLVDRPYRQCWHDKVARTFVSGGVSAD